jgi:hypothetical protein
MYRAHRWDVKIESVQVVKRTASFVTYLVKEWGLKGDVMRERRERDEGKFFLTWEACRAAAVERQRIQVEHAKEKLHRERTELGQWESLKEPS